MPLRLSFSTGRKLEMISLLVVTVQHHEGRRPFLEVVQAFTNTWIVG